MEIAGTMPDPTLDDAVASIMKKISDDDASRTDVNGNDREPVDGREDREERDPIERQGTSDLEEAERNERAAKDGEAGGDEAGAEEDFIELPAAEDGKEPERIRVAEALEAVQKLRQMDGDIATAVIKVEEEAFAKQDTFTQKLAQTFDLVAKQANVTLQVMRQMFPQEPSRLMLDETSQHYNPAAYWQERNYYDDFVKHFHKVSDFLDKAEQGKSATGSQQDGEFTRRELDRTARYIPEFKDPAAREAKKAEWLDVLKPYGLTQEDLNEITDHRALRIINDFAKAKLAERKAPEVRKAVQEKAPKIVKGRANPNRDAGNGRYISDAKKELKETGSQDAFAKKLLRSGFLDTL